MSRILHWSRLSLSFFLSSAFNCIGLRPLACYIHPCKFLFSKFLPVDVVTNSSTGRIVYLGKWKLISGIFPSTLVIESNHLPIIKYNKAKTGFKVSITWLGRQKKNSFAIERQRLIGTTRVKLEYDRANLSRFSCVRRSHPLRLEITLVQFSLLWAQISSAISLSWNRERIGGSSPSKCAALTFTETSLIAYGKLVGQVIGRHSWYSIMWNNLTIESKITTTSVESGKAWSAYLPLTERVQSTTKEKQRNKNDLAIGYDLRTQVATGHFKRN